MGEVVYLNQFRNRKRLESQRRDIAKAMGVPANLLGASDSGAKGSFKITSSTLAHGPKGGWGRPHG